MTTGLTLLLVDDDQAFATRLSRFLVKSGYEVEHVPNGEQGVATFEQRRPDAVLLDLMLPGMDGLETLRKMRTVDQVPVILVMTAHASVTTAVDAMRLGALDYVTKPLELDALTLKLERAAQLMALRTDYDYLLQQDRKGFDFEDFVGRSPAMRSVYEKIQQVSQTDDTTVLITGPSGTGKELVARAIHSQSTRRHKPLMQIDCTSIPMGLLESELFGHERGAFTGADRCKKGLVELADGGTLLLDEIGDMPLELQAKFLRVIQERRFRRVGGTRDILFDVRVVAATNQDLQRMSEESTFRSDLFYRLKVFEIRLPPLRERGDDIMVLADSFLRDFCGKFRKPILRMDAEAKLALEQHSYPGNVRELRNIMEQAVILARDGILCREHLSIAAVASLRPAIVEEPQSSLSLDALGSEPLKKAETELIRQAMRRTDGNKRQASELLGISRFALQRKLDKLVLEVVECEPDGRGEAV